mmetsp:Transcript_15935/g.50816  ORF Transcript_15935/g.50816 Transcript_15935/m.50816 type:complete len:86 (-) Transcript_15935:406-663(-)
MPPSSRVRVRVRVRPILAHFAMCLHLSFPALPVSFSSPSPSCHRAGCTTALSCDVFYSIVPAPFLHDSVFSLAFGCLARNSACKF